jgi:repressor LexA
MSTNKGKKHSARLTPRQMQILTSIRDYQRNNGYSPTMQELADSMGITKVTVFEHVEALVEKNLLHRSPHKARSLELTAAVAFPDDRPTVIPFAGRIAAGFPVEAIEDRESVDLEQLFATQHRRFILQVQGDSMIDEQIRDGDLVVVEDRPIVKNGDTVVALIDGQDATLKQMYRENGRVRLQPANPDFEPIVVDESAIQIQGVVIGVVRTY